MDHEEVVEFLAQVPLLQRLPSSSLRKIAGVVEVKHYDAGDFIVHEGQVGDGIYFVWVGEAEVSGSMDEEEGNHPELQLKQYDYFGYGAGDSIYQVNVRALSKLTCLVLRRVDNDLLQPRSIWNADETYEDYALVEHIMRLEPIEVNMFRGFTLPGSPAFRQVFGGQLLGQALAAASKTVDCLKIVHSLHSYFVLAGDNNLPIIYQVYRIRDGKSFATRQVNATQRGAVIFTLLASFKKEEHGFEHQEASMPDVPSPEMLLSMEDLRERRITDPRLPMTYRNAVARENFVPWPIEIRFCESEMSLRQHKSHPSLSYWFKAKGKLSDDPALHSCVIAYASDLIFLGVSLNPHRKKSLKTVLLSLDHVMWFHRKVKADDWLLYVIESPSAADGRGFSTGRIYNRQGELVVSLTQEGIIRKIKQRNDTNKAKL